MLKTASKCKSRSDTWVWMVKTSLKSQWRIRNIQNTI